MMKNPTALFLTALGKALAIQSLYGDGHPARVAARERVHEVLAGLLQQRGALRISILDSSVIIGSRVLAELKGWEWAPRLSAVGIQRLEIDVVPAPTADDVDLLIAEMHARVAAAVPNPSTLALRNFRFGPLGVATTPDEHGEVAGDLLESLAHLPLTEEASAVRWIHDEIAAGGDVPLAEVEALVHSLAMAIHREQHVVMPLLEIRESDPFTTSHSCNVSMLSMGLAERLGVSPSDARAIGTAALLHDIGKVHLPPELLTKAEPLTAEETALLESHPLVGARLLSSRARGHALAATVAYEHHLWENGHGGYPTLFWPRRCHFASRVVHVCNLYDVLSTNRPGRQALPHDQVIAALTARAGTELDAEITQAFVSMVESLDLQPVPVGAT